MEEQPDGTWVVFNDVAGFALRDGDDEMDCDNPTKIFTDYKSAREAMIQIAYRYCALK